MKVSLCWWNTNNFGDALNLYLFKAFGIDVDYKNGDEADILSIGSMLETVLLKKISQKNLDMIPLPIKVYGTGYHVEKAKDIVYPEELHRKADIYALRGKISKIRYEKINNTNLEGIALGDPGLLASKIFNLSKVKKKYRLGIIPHFSDAMDKDLLKIHKNIKDSIIINVLEDPYEVVKKIVQCECIISTAMHPIIVADSFLIPNIWANSGTDTVSKYKFYDYYSALDIKPRMFDLMRGIFDDNQINKVIKEYSVTKDIIKKVQNQLIEAFPYKKDINFLTEEQLKLLKQRINKEAHKLKIHKRPRKKTRLYKFLSLYWLRGKE